MGNLSSIYFEISFTNGNSKVVRASDISQIERGENYVQIIFKNFGFIKENYNKVQLLLSLEKNSVESWIKVVSSQAKIYIYS